MATNEDVSFLAASENRVDALLALRELGAADLRSVAETVDASRRTVKRILDALEERGWILSKTNDREYRISALGWLVLDSYLDVVDRLETADQLAPLLERISAEELGLDPLALAGADVIVKGDNQPYAPMDRVLRIRRNASEIREVVNIVQADSAAQFRDRVERGELTATVILEAGVVNAVTSNDDYAESFEGALGADGASFYVFDGVVPFLLGVMDDTVVLGATDDEGIPDTIVVSEDPVVRDWAESRFESYREAAEEITPAHLA